MYDSLLNMGNMLKTNFSIKGTAYDIVVLFAFSSNKCSGESVGCSHVLSIDVYELRPHAYIHVHMLSLDN